MYHCPRCKVELAPDARYCPRCGFNQTNARMQKVASPQAPQSNAVAIPVTPAPLPDPDVPAEFPPTPTALLPHMSRLTSNLVHLLSQHIPLINHQFLHRRWQSVNRCHLHSRRIYSNKRTMIVSLPVLFARSGQTRRQDLVKTCL